MSRFPPRIARLTARLAAPLPALALAAAALATARFQLDPGAAATTAFFGWLALGVLGALALPPRQPAALPAAAALAVGLALLGLPHLGVLRPAATMALLAAAVLAHGAALHRRAAALGPGAWLALALAAQLVAEGERLFLAPTAAATAAWLLGLPLAAALAATALERGAGDTRPATAVALAVFLGGPGWTPAGVFALALAALAARAFAARPGARALVLAALATAPLALGAEAPWLLPAVLAATALAAAPVAPGPRRLAAGGLAALALLALVGAALPWHRSAPATTLLTAALGPGGRVAARPVEMQPVVLAAGSPRFETALDGGTITAVVVDSYLTRSLELPCGTAVARLRVELDGAAFEAPLEVGRDSAEWAADRADVAAALACPPPAPWTSWLPAGGRFLGHHFRARFRLDRPVAARRLVIERPAELPGATALAIFHVAVER